LLAVVVVGVAVVVAVAVVFVVAVAVVGLFVVLVLVLVLVLPVGLPPLRKVAAPGDQVYGEGSGWVKLKAWNAERYDTMPGVEKQRYESNAKGYRAQSEVESATIRNIAVGDGIECEGAP
jgi:hypothetical protein